jgi:ABC-type multidrug transport system ATPase subunit
LVLDDFWQFFWTFIILRNANGGVIDGPVHPSMIGFVHQDDIFIETLTPVEHMTFHHFLRYPTTSDKDRNEAVLTLLYQLRLVGCQHTRIGSPITEGLGAKGLSGGERKRLSFATSIMHK